MKKKTIKKRTIILCGIFAFIAVVTIAFTIIFCIKGDYPKEMYIALIPPTIVEFWILFKLKENEEEVKKNDSQILQKRL